MGVIVYLTTPVPGGKFLGCNLLLALPQLTLVQVVPAAVLGVGVMLAVSPCLC